MDDAVAHCCQQEKGADAARQVRAMAVPFPTEVASSPRHRAPEPNLVGPRGGISPWRAAGACISRAVMVVAGVVGHRPSAAGGARRADCPRGGSAGVVRHGRLQLATQYWLLPSAGSLLIVLAIGLGALWLPWGLAAYLLLGDRITARGTLAAVVVLPSAWVMAEAVRSRPSLGGPWASLGASQWNQPATPASASLGGVWLTSFLIAASNTAIAGVILHRRVSARVIAAAVALACAGLGPAWFGGGRRRPPGRRDWWRSFGRRAILRTPSPVRRLAKR